MANLAQETHEQAVVRVGANRAARVTPSGITNAIEEVSFFRPTETLTTCVMKLKNGFVVTGESACASPANYNREIGERIAHENAREKIWPLEGYLLREKLALVEKAAPASLPLMATYVGMKAVHATPMHLGEYNNLRGWPMPADEDPDAEGFLLEYPYDGDRPNLAGFAGYVSWSPRAVFEKSYELIAPPAEPVTAQPEAEEISPVPLFGFGRALALLGIGEPVARFGWNGKRMFIYRVNEGQYLPRTKVAEAAFGGDLVPYRPYLAMKTAQGDVVPWVASQSDLLADDWYLVEL